MKLTSKLLIVVLFSLLVLTSCKYFQKDEIETIVEPEQITGVGDGTVKFVIQSSDGTELFYVINDGNALIYGNLTIGGNLTVEEDIVISSGQRVCFDITCTESISKNATGLYIFYNNVVRTKYNSTNTVIS